MQTYKFYKKKIIKERKKERKKEREKEKKEKALLCFLGVSFLSPILSFAGMNNTTLFSCDLEVLCSISGFMVSLSVLTNIFI